MSLQSNRKNLSQGPKSIEKKFKFVEKKTSQQYVILHSAEERSFHGAAKVFVRRPKNFRKI